MDQNNIVDELLNKLKSLEEKNSSLRESVESIKLKISNYKPGVDLEDGKR